MRYNLKLQFRVTHFTTPNNTEEGREWEQGPESQIPDFVPNVTQWCRK